MNKGSFALLTLMAVSSLSLWGCANQKTGATNAKIKELEVRYLKMEEDYHVVVAANEAHRKKIVNLENQRAELAAQVAELKAISQERDDFKIQLATRTQERDTLHGSMQQLGKELQGLMGRIESATNSVPGPNLTSATPTSRRSE
jgi:chromosome segregation ATPase